MRDAPLLPCRVQLADREKVDNPVAEKMLLPYTELPRIWASSSVDTHDRQPPREVLRESSDACVDPTGRGPRCIKLVNDQAVDCVGRLSSLGPSVRSAPSIGQGTAS